MTGIGRWMTRAAFLLVGGLLVVGSGCTAQSPDEVADESGASGEAVSTLDGVVDEAYLSAGVWDDGRAEVAFYRVQREYDMYGNPEPQTFIAGTYLVKQPFSREAMSKAVDGGGEPAFKYAIFHEVNSGSYQYKRNWVTNVRKRDLAPMKQSLSSFDWCSNRYRELAFEADGTVSVLHRSDDYGNDRRSFDAPDRAVPFAALPTLVRALPDDLDAVTVNVVTPDGTVEAEIRGAGPDTVQVAGASAAARRVTVDYAGEVPSPFGETAAPQETYWRGTGPERLLLKIEASDGGYRVALVEHLRTAYWQENLWPRLERIEDRP